MFRKIKCSKCESQYDESQYHCPHCGEINTQNPDAKSSRNVTFLPILKQIGLFAIGWGGFELIGAIISLIITLIGINVYGYTGIQLDQFLKSANNVMIANFVSYSIVFAALVLLLFKDNLVIFKTFKNWKGYIAGAVCFGAILFFNIIYSSILSACGIVIEPNDNEKLLEEIIANMPIVSLLFFAFIGPICEELTYRVGLYSFLRRINKYLAIIVTVIIFALIHFNFTSDSIINELYNLPTYLFSGFALTFVYSKFGFASSLSAHVTNNLFSVLSIIIRMRQ